MATVAWALFAACHLAPALAAAPPNDAFASRVRLTGVNVATNGNNVGATKEANEPDLGLNNFGGNGKSVWWEWTAPASGKALISTRGSSFAAVLAVFTNNTLVTLKRVASSDFDPDDFNVVTSALTLSNVVAGTAYQIVVDGYRASVQSEAEQGDIKLSISITQPAPPVITWSSPAGSARLTAAVPVQLCAQVTSPGGPVARVEFFEGDALLGTFTAPPGQPAVGATLSACVTWTNPPPGLHTIVARVTDPAGVTAEAAPVALKFDLRNDAFANRLVISNAVATVTGSNVGATLEEFEKQDSIRNPLAPGDATVWYTWQAPVAGEVRMSLVFATNGISQWNSWLVVYKGDAPANLVRVASNAMAEQQVVFTNPAPGTVYQIAVGGLASQGNVYQDSFTLSLKVSDLPVVEWRGLANPANFVAGAVNFECRAEANDADGIVKVEFLVDGRVVHTDLARPFTFSTNYLAEGVRELVARATDALGFSTDSAAVSVIVTVPPGVKKWEFNAGSEFIQSCPAVGVDGTIYAGSLNGVLFALNPDGSKRWENFLGPGGSINSSPALGRDGTIYCASANKLYAVSPEGTNRWVYTAGENITTSPAIDAVGNIYFGAQDKKLRSLTSGGNLNWEFATGGAVNSTPAVNSGAGLVYFASDDGKFYSLDLFGNQRAEYNPGDGPILTSPAIVDGGVTVLLQTNRRLIALRHDLEFLWSVNTDFATVTSPVTGPDGTIYVGAGRLHAISPDGKLKWVRNVGSDTIFGAPTVAADGTILAAGNSTGILYAFAPDGKTNWTARVEGATSAFGVNSPSIGSDGTIYLANHNGSLYAFKGTAPLADSPWPKFHRNLRQSGDATSLPGDKLWEVKTASQTSLCPAIGQDGNVYFSGGNDGLLHIVSPDGQVRQAVVGADLGSAPAVAPKGTLYLHGFDPSTSAKTLWALAGTNTLWRAPLSDAITTALALGTDGTIYFGTRDKKFYAVTPDGAIRWTIPLASDIESSPVIGTDGTIYFGTTDGKLRALDPAGQTRWEIDTGLPIRGDLAIGGDGMIYVAGGNNSAQKLFAFHPDLTRKWEFEGAGGYSNPVVGPDGVIYVGSTYHGFFAINPDGTQKWRVLETDYFRSGGALAADGTIYVGSASGWFYAFDAQGNVQWKFQTGAGFSGQAPAIGPEGNVYVASDRFWAFKGSSPLATDAPWPKLARNQSQNANAGGLPGDTRRRIGTVYGVTVAPSIGPDGTVYFTDNGNLHAVPPNGAPRTLPGLFGSGTGLTVGSDNTLFVTAGVYGVPGDGIGSLRAIGPDGTNRWIFDAHAPAAPAALGADGTIYFGTTSNTVLAIGQDGVERWRQPVPGGVFSPPAVGPDGTIYFGMDAPILRAFTPAGVVKWSFSITNGYAPSIAGPVVGTEGVIYFGTDDRRIYAVRPDGTLKWINESARYLLRSSPVVAGGLVYFVSEDDHLHAVEEATGALRWSFSPGPGPEGGKGIFSYSVPALAADGSIVLATDDGRLLALAADGKSVRWTAGLPSGPTTPVIALDGTVWVGLNGGGLVAVKGSAPPATGPWPAYQHDNRRTANASSLPGETLRLLEGSGGLVIPPSIGPDGTIYFSSWGDYDVQALSPAGVRRVLTRLPEQLVTGITIDQDRTLFVTAGGNQGGSLRAIGPDESTRWVFDTADTASPPALATDGTLYFATDGRLVFAVGGDGRELWRKPLPVDRFTSPVIGPDGTVYIGTDTNRLVALTPGGDIKWQFTIPSIYPGRLTGLAVGADGAICFGYRDNFLAVRADGSLKWANTTVGAYFRAAPVVGSGGTIYVTDLNSRLNAMEEATGALRWSFNVGPQPDGTASLNFPVPALAADGSIVVVTDDGRVLAVAADGQRVVWQGGFSTFATTTPAIAADGTVWVGMVNGPAGLAALKGAAPLASGPWPAYGHDNRRTANATGSGVVNPGGPVNDLFVNRAQLGGATARVAVANERATSEAGEPLHAGQPGGKSLWWSWTAPATGIVTLATRGSAFDTLLAIYTGATLATLKPVASDDDSGGDATSRLQFAATAGVTYAIAVDGLAGASGALILALDLNVPPAVKLTAPADGGEFFTGTPLSLAADAADPDGSITRVEFYAGPDLIGSATQSPYQVTWQTGQPGRHRLSARAYDNTGFYTPSAPVVIDLVPPPALNDNFASAARLAGSVAQATVSNAGATREAGEPAHAGKAGHKSVWWTWTAPYAGTVTVSTAGSGFDTLLAVYTGTTLPSLQPVAADDDSGGAGTSRLVFEAAERAVYYIAVDGFGDNGGEVDLSLAEVVPPVVVMKSPANGTTLPGPANILLTATAFDSDDLVARVEFFHEESSLGAVTKGTNNQFSLVWTNAPAGEYGLAATATDQAGNVTTSAVVSVKVLGTTLAPVIVQPPLARTNALGGTAIFSLTVQGTSPFAYQWRVNATPLTGQTNGALRLDRLQPGDAGDYSVVVRNAGGAVTSAVARLVVAPPPVITAEPSSQRVTRGAPASFAVAAESLLPVTYQWLFNGVPLPNATNAALKLPAAQAGDAGSYAALAINAAGAVTSAEAVLEVETTPSLGGLPLLPRDDFWITDGPVRAVAQTNGVIYLGGAFSYVGPNIGGGAWIDATNGVADRAAPRVNGEVSVVVADGAGGWFIGGKFTSVGGLGRPNLAHVRADRTVDAAWNPAPGAPVRALVLTNGILYAGGQFTNLGATSRRYLAAVTAATGEPTAWNPDLDAQVAALAFADGLVYVGGYFSRVGLVGVKNLAAIKTTDGLATGWRPAADRAVLALVAGPGVIYVGGEFTTIESKPRGRLAAIGFNGFPVEDWRPNANNRVYALALAGDTLFAGGDFDAIDGEPRAYLAALDRATGKARVWGPSAGTDTAVDSSVQALAVDQANLYLGGQFSRVGGKDRQRLAALDLVRGQVQDWNPNPNERVFALATAGGSVYAGGRFVSAGGVGRGNLAALSASTGAALPWEVSVVGTVQTLAVAGDRLFLGGQFLEVNDQPRAGLAAVELSSGELADWSPGVDGTVYALGASLTTVYAAGAFTQAAGTPRNNLAAFDARTGDLAGWNPDANKPAYALTVTSNRIYAGGDFTSIGRGAPGRLAALDLVSGDALAWNPRADGAVQALLEQAGTIYAGGYFTNVDLQPRPGLAAAQAANGAVTAWHPAVGGNVRPYVQTLASADPLLFVGGGFGSLDGESRANLGAVELATGHVIDWSPNPGGPVFALGASGPTALFVGGQFTTVAGQFRPFFAAFAPRGFPVILRQPRPAVVAVSSNAVFTVEVTGLDPLAYQWRRNGTNLPGATNAVLLIPNATAANDGAYEVVATNPAGAVTSATVALRALQPPRIVRAPVAREARIGETVGFSVGAEGSGPLTYQWLKNGQPLPGATGDSLVITNAQVAVAGSYSVIVANALRLVESAGATLTIRADRVVFSDSFAGRATNTAAAGQFFGSNQGATREAAPPAEPLHAGKPGNSSVWLSWKAPATGIATFGTAGSDFDTLLAVYTGAALGQLREVVSDEDSGDFFSSKVVFNADAGAEYQIAIDGFGGATGNLVLTWSLEVSPDEVPRIITQPVSQSVARPGLKAAFTVEADGKSGAGFQYQWYFNDVPLPGATAPALVIPRVENAHLGRYQATVTKGTRSTRSVAAVLEFGPVPTITTREKIEELLPGSFTGSGPRPASLRPAALGASVVAGLPGQQVFGNAGSTAPSKAAIGADSPVRWYPLTADFSGTMIVDTVGSDIDTMLYLYEVTDPNDASLFLRPPKYTDDNSAPDGVRSRLEFPVIKGDSFFAGASGVNHATGEIRLNWRLGLKPVITAQPAGRTVASGGDVVLSVTASGNPAPSFQWRLNGVDLPGATNAVLVLNRLQATDTGRYQALAINFVGSQLSQAAEVTMQSPAPPRLEAAGFAVNGRFGFRLSAPGGTGSYVVQVSTNLFDWRSIFTNRVQSGFFEFIDVEPPFQRRFYRALPVP